MAKLNLNVLALTAAIATFTVPVAAQSAAPATAQVAPATCEGKKWEGCSFEQRLASVKAFCDTSLLRDSDKTVLAKASRQEFLVTLNCVEEVRQPVVQARVSPPPRVEAPAPLAAPQPLVQDEPDEDVVTDRGPTQVAFAPRRPVPQHGNLDRDLAARALQVLGPAPTANHSFAGVKRRAEPAPRGCTRTAQRVQGGTYYRVVCQ